MPSRQRIDEGDAPAAPTTGTDRYRRLLAYVTTRAGRNLGAEQLADGWAKTYVFGKDTTYM